MRPANPASIPTPLFSAILSAALFLMLALAPFGVKPTAAIGAELIRGRAEVIDGDTIRVAGRTVRLDGIDAPESRQECEDVIGRSYLCGQSATRFLSRLIGRDRVACKIVGQDAYGRDVGICEAGGREINAAMVEAGWALAFRRYSERYIGAEEQARQAGAGLWEGTFDPAWEWRAGIVADILPGDCVIKGNIARDGKRIYHMPFQDHYDRTEVDEDAGELWFCSEDEARAAGWRRALR